MDWTSHTHSSYVESRTSRDMVEARDYKLSIMTRRPQQSCGMEKRRELHAEERLHEDGKTIYIRYIYSMRYNP
jgi:hypothetical protein